jgi:hypothetical protein
MEKLKMSTRSTISLELDNASILQVYCHFDGYLEGVGKILKNHYTSFDDVYNLIKRGNLSHLGDTIESSGFYCSDHDDDLDESYQSFKNFNSYVKLSRKEDYNYIFRADGRWYVEHKGKFSDL